VIIVVSSLLKEKIIKNGIIRILAEKNNDR